MMDVAPAHPISEIRKLSRQLKRECGGGKPPGRLATGSEPRGSPLVFRRARDPTDGRYAEMPRGPWKAAKGTRKHQTEVRT